VVELNNNNNIYHEDCKDFMKRSSSHGMRVDVIVTSPPYNINKEYGSYRDNKERKDYLDWLYEIAQLSYLILKDNGSFFLNIGGTPSYPMLPFEVIEKFKKAEYQLQNTIHWIKSISFEKTDVGKNNGIRDYSIGHFKPIVSDRYLTDIHEYIFHFTKEGNVKLNKRAIGVPYQDKTNIGRWKSATQDKRDRGNVWFIPYPTIQESRHHPAVFPEKLPYLCIKMHGVKPDMLVYDPFMGIGTTALACIKLGVNYMGTEIDADYIKVALEYIEKRKSEMTSDNWSLEDNNNNNNDILVVDKKTPKEV
jgi:site-specific DNA-methyltransferase (adenine-specific)